MPLKKSKSTSAFKSNVKELIGSKPSATREKAIKTIAKKQGITPKAAKAKQAVAISYPVKRKSK